MSGCCCSNFSTDASEQFNQKKVAQELKNYRENGPRKTTRMLTDSITRAGQLRGTVLDIGAGIGGLTLALLDGGATSAIAVDASSAYVDAARVEAMQRGRETAIRFVHADFVQVASQLPCSSIVTLDRVVCCYPSCEQLLEAALSLAERCLALSYPRDVWYVRIGTLLENGERWLRRSSFRTFVHPVALIEETIQRAGFRLTSRRQTRVWSVDVYVRP